MSNYKKLILLNILLFFIGCESIFFHPVKTVIYHPDICANQPEDILIENKDNLTLHSWLFKAKVKKSKGTIIFFHGNASNISINTVPILWFLDEGYNLFVSDYRGYGISEGTPSINGVLQDGIDIVDGFMEIDNIDKDNIIIYGQSLGGAVASFVAANSPHTDKFKGLILDSTFTTWRDIAKDVASSMFITWAIQYPISWSYPKDKSSYLLLPKSKIKNTLIIHSKNDELIPVEHAQKLYNIAKEYKELVLIDNVAHAKLINTPKSRKAILKFINKAINN